jgi:hypothetical protein
MTEAEAISFATLHLEGEAHEWWYHGLVTLGHEHITSYKEFTERLMDRFDRRDPEIHFRDLAQLRQTGTAEAFIAEFQRVAVIVTDISEPRLVMLFTEGLTKPLRGWVKAYRPHSLPDVVLEIWRIRYQELNPLLNPLYRREIRIRRTLKGSGRASPSWMMTHDGS